MSWTDSVKKETNHIHAVYDFPWKDLQWIEFYAGRARATLCMKSAGLRAARLDYMYYHGDGNNYYNILTDGGFSFLGKEPVEC